LIYLKSHGIWRVRTARAGVTVASTDVRDVLSVPSPSERGARFPSTGPAIAGIGGCPDCPGRRSIVQIDSSSNVDAFTKLSNKTDQVAVQVGVSVTKTVMDGAKDMMMELMNSLQPHLGQNVDRQL
jgi:hypothetical protein